MEGHIVRTFDGDIMNLRMQVLAVGGLAIDQVQRAVQALVEHSDEGARDVIARCPQVTANVRGIEEEIVALIARRQPVASDLRTILTVGRAATDLDRVGNGARKIALAAIELHAVQDGVPLGHFYHDVRKMTRLALAMLRDALDCFDRVDVARAEAVVLRDVELDREFQMAMRELLTFVMEDPRFLRAALQTVFLIKALERIGDHARNIAGLVPRLAPRDEPPAEPVVAVPSRREASSTGA